MKSATSRRKNRMGKNRDLFKKTGDAEGTFHARMGAINGRKSNDLTEAEEIRKVARIHRRTIQKRA